MALVLGGYVNGYSIIRELYGSGITTIWLFDYGSSLARYSNKILGVSTIAKTSSSILKSLNDLRDQFDYIVCYPTDDLHLEMLCAIKDKIEDFCFLPFNSDNLMSCLDKNFQYESCKSIGIPYPRSVEIKAEADFVKLSELTYPVLLKPSKRDDIRIRVFRNLYLESKSDLNTHYHEISKSIAQGIKFIASEFVPGDDTNIFAYTAYRAKNGNILNEWVGKKLTQYPGLFGIFSSATNCESDAVLEQGRALINKMNLTGIVEPEFKFDERDGSFKLMEINLRSMMWHRVGNLSGVELQVTQWLDATGKTILPQNQITDKKIHFLYMKHELLNLVFRKKYIVQFRYNVFGGDTRHFAVFDKADLKPFFYDLISFAKEFLSICLKRLRILFVK